MNKLKQTAQALRDAGAAARSEPSFMAEVIAIPMKPPSAEKGWSEHLFPNNLADQLQSCLSECEAWMARHSPTNFSSATDGSHDAVASALGECAKAMNRNVFDRPSTQETAAALQASMAACAKAATAERDFMCYSDPVGDFVKAVLPGMLRVVERLAATMEEHAGRISARLTELDVWRGACDVFTSLSRITIQNGQPRISETEPILPVWHNPFSRLADMLRDPHHVPSASDEESLIAAIERATRSRLALQMQQAAVRKDGDRTPSRITGRDSCRLSHIRELDAAIKATWHDAASVTDQNSLEMAHERAVSVLGDCRHRLSEATAARREMGGSRPLGSAFKTPRMASGALDVSQAVARLDAFTLHACESETLKFCIALLLSAQKQSDVNALVDPSGDLERFDEKASFPAELLLAAGKAEEKRLTAIAKRLEDARVTCARLAAEMADEMHARDNPPGDVQAKLGQLKQQQRRLQNKLSRAHLDLEDATLDPDATEAVRDNFRDAVSLAKDSVHQANATLATEHTAIFERVNAFPELLHELAHAKGLPLDLVAIFQSDRSLQHFDDRKKIGSGSRWPVYRASLEMAWGPEEVALKEYTVNASELLVCYKEASLLRRLRHPAIVELEAIFVNDGRFYLQMPLYPNGTLDEWYSREKPNSAALAAVLQQICLAVAHVHTNHVIHSDIKPTNVLMDRTHRPRLGDFDVSVDDATRRTQEFGRKATAAAGTLGFLAPEVARGGAATYKSDMFALGQTFAAIVPRDQRPVDLSRLIDSLCAENAEARPSAEKAIEHAYFQQLYTGRMEAEETCVICQEEGIPRSGGLRCASRDEAHFTCDSCLEQHVHFASTDDLRERNRREGCVLCPKAPTECNGGPYTDAALARHLSDGAFARYLTSRRELIEQRLEAEKDAELQQAIQAELARLAQLDERQRRIEQIKTSIVEDVLTMKCPREGCRQAYDAFNGCTALYCSRCPCKFCGWCLQDCGDSDAHAHVRSCRAKPPGVDTFFPNPWSSFENHWKQRKAEGVRRELQTLSADEQRDIRHALRVQLAAHGIESLV